LVGISWIGFDQPRSLGGNETGGHAALPIWIGYMGKALKNVPESQYTMPDGISVININLQNGAKMEEGGTPEFFYQDFPPQSGSQWADDLLDGIGKAVDEIKNQLF
jgi:penicillin-binding protein 1A